MVSLSQVSLPLSLQFYGMEVIDCDICLYLGFVSPSLCMFYPLLPFLFTQQTF